MIDPIGAIFGLGVALRNGLYDRQVLKSRKLALPVVSIGNISVGGSGKTPFVVALGNLLKERGIEFDVLSRGYGRSSAEIAIVDPAGTPAEFGDEPLLITRKLGVPVVVGADRYQAGLLAEAKLPSKLHLLDDGFQHRRLHRDFDIVMLPGSDLKGNLLPFGRLREPLGSLGRADAAVIGADTRPPRQAKQAKLVWRARREIHFADSRAKTVAFCGIARPRQFFAGLKQLGMELVATVAFRDHHRYQQNDVNRLLRIKRQTGALEFITTEKDAINLGPLLAELRTFRTATLDLELQAPETVIETLLRTVEERIGRPLR
ncbi:MAG TPA: tetraacyldisaccharide 4'-kinase [Candidatus Angelobacter sp.]|nr:tetraacyldisaccharide 4'-kinase [Candidatus Angelobacter sp.]